MEQVDAVKRADEGYQVIGAMELRLHVNELVLHRYKFVVE